MIIKNEKVSSSSKLSANSAEEKFKSNSSGIRSNILDYKEKEATLNSSI